MSLHPEWMRQKLYTGGEMMTNTLLLRQKLEESGYRLNFIAEKIGLTYQGFLKKVNNESEFRASEILGLQDLLKLTDHERDLIFFAV